MEYIQAELLTSRQESACVSHSNHSASGIALLDLWFDMPRIG